jgi:hypothetical protein
MTTRRRLLNVAKMVQLVDSQDSEQGKRANLANKCIIPSIESIH